MVSVLSKGQEADSTGIIKRMLRGVEYSAELSGTAGTGDYAPLWLHSNRHGLSSIESNSGYLRGGVFRNTCHSRNFR